MEVKYLAHQSTPFQHSQSRLFECTHCGKTFNFSSVLRRHEMKHSGVGLYMCPECPKRFRRNMHLIAHLQIHNGERNHEALHDNEGYPYVCTHCDKQFKREETLRSHEVTHNGEYCCTQCDKMFDRSSKLERHKLIHTDNGAHVCTICGKQFELLSVLRRHEQIHSETKQYSCSHCAKCFVTVNYLLAHEKRHVNGGDVNQLLQGSGQEKGLDTSPIQEMKDVLKIGEVNKNSVGEKVKIGKKKMVSKREALVRRIGRKSNGIRRNIDSEDIDSIVDNNSDGEEMNGNNLNEADSDREGTSGSGEIHDGESDQQECERYELNGGIKEQGEYEWGDVMDKSNDLEQNSSNGIDKTKTGRCTLPSESTGSKFWCSGCSEGFDSEEDVRECFYQHIHPTTAAETIITSDRTSIDHVPKEAIKAAADGDNPIKVFTCRWCGKLFKTALFLRQHKRKHISEHGYACTLCSKTFSKSSNLCAHLKLHLGVRPHSCVVCSSTFTTKSNLRAHQVIHNGERPYACTQCEKSFGHSSSLTKHLRTHLPLWNQNPFMCQECGKTFTQQYNLRIHQRQHTGERPHQCSRCDRAFAKVASLRRHVLRHDGKRPFLCTQCDKGFSNESDRICHERVHVVRDAYILQQEKGEQGGGTFITSQLPTVKIDERNGCTQITPLLPIKTEKQGGLTRVTLQSGRASCDLYMSVQTGAQVQADGFTQIISQMKADTGEQHKCPQCGKLFINHRLLKRHVFNHLNVRPYTCAQCGGTFKNASDLHRHERIHNTDLWFMCQHCDKKFAQLSHVQLHEKKHTGERPFACMQCERRFTNSSDLKKHNRIHTGERPYVCVTCSREFTFSSNLRLHERKDHGANL